MGTHLPSPKGAHPQFSANVRCGQTARWMKTPFGTEVDLGPGHIVLDGDPAPLPAKGAQQPPSFRPMSIVAMVAHLSYCWALVSYDTMHLFGQQGHHTRLCMCSSSLKHPANVQRGITSKIIPACLTQTTVQYCMHSTTTMSELSTEIQPQLHLMPLHKQWNDRKNYTPAK